MGVGGLHVRTVSDRETPHEISGRIEQGDYYLQRAAAGDSIGVTFLSSDRGSLVVGAAKSIGKCSQTFLPEHTYRGSLYPFMLPTVTKAKLEHFAELVTNAVGIRGLWQADFLSKDGELALLEINPRWSASMELMEAACNFRLIELHLACIYREMNEDAWMRVSQQTEGAGREKQPLLFGKMIAYAPHSFVVTHEQSDRWWNRVWGGAFSSELEKIRYGDIPEAGTTVDAGAPILTCFAAHTSEEALVQKLAAEVETLLSA
jgi:predicted ATP-grasp superfamily ATP-dependent carboligase